MQQRYFREQVVQSRNTADYPRVDDTIVLDREYPLFTGAVETQPMIGALSIAIGEYFAKRYGEAPVLVVEVLEGAHRFASDVARRLPGADRATVKVNAGYESTQGTGTPTVSEPLAIDGQEVTSLADYENVLVIDDVLDRGLTMEYLLTQYLSSLPGSPDLKATFLFEKQTKQRAHETESALGMYVPRTGMRIPDWFIVGYGIDWEPAPGIHIGRPLDEVYVVNGETARAVEAAAREDPERVRQLFEERGMFTPV